MAEMMIVLFFLFMAAIPLLLLGIVQYKSNTPVGFWSGKEPPRIEQVTNVKAYNHQHGVMWMLYGAGLVLSYLVGLPFGEMAAVVCVMVECFGGLIGMILYHQWLNRQYYRE